MLDALLKCGDTNVVIQDLPRQRTALHYLAAARNSADINAYIMLEKTRFKPLDPITHRALIDMSDDAGDTALHIAQRCGNLGAVNLLKYFGTNTQVKNQKSEKPLEQSSYDCPGPLTSQSEGR